jgi:hypothetical protein
MKPMSRSLQARLMALTLLLGPALAAAQAADATNPATLRSSSDLTNNTYSFNAGDCSGNISVTWTYVGTWGSSFSTALTLWSTTAGSCLTTGPSTTDLSYSSVPWLTFVTSKSGTFTVPISTLPGFNVDNGDGGVKNFCGETGVEVTQRLCGAISSITSAYSSTVTVNQPDPLILLYDTKPPAAPAVSDVGSLDSSAVVNFTYDTGTTTVYAQYSEAGLDGGDVWNDGPSVTVANTSKLTIQGLTNNVVYDVQLFGVDQAGNVSEASAIAQVEPIHTIGFFETLHNAGSTEQGGCAVAGSMLVPLAALGLLRALARRSR